jgi:DNA repair ATPase RecN
MQHPQPNDRTRNAGFVRGPDVNSSSCGHGLADFGFVHQRHEKFSVDTLLDEIDAEIGGRLGPAVGKKLHEVARHHQVVIVTHLAPVAAFAQQHFLVNKEVGGAAGDERTRSTVRQLKRSEVAKELAAMATGDGSDASALKQDRSLVAKARENTQ